MEELLYSHELGDDEKLAFMMKQMLYQANLGDVAAVMASMAAMADALPDKPAHQRIFRYNAACALWRLKQYKAAEKIAREVIAEYFDVLGISPADVIGRSGSTLWSVVNKTISVNEDLKHLADALDLCAIVVNKQGRSSGLLRLHAMKFYEIVSAVDSLIRVGQDLVDEFIGRGDFEGAKDIMEKNVLPYVIAYNLIARIIAVRSQYAVVLAYCGEHDAADAEMARLLPYAGGFSEQQHSELLNQRGLVAQLRFGQQTNTRTQRKDKVGRNGPCPCGSGLKYKKCHG
jgi:hypothetical protein